MISDDDDDYEDMDDDDEDEDAFDDEDVSELYVVVWTLTLMVPSWSRATRARKNCPRVAAGPVAVVLALMRVTLTRKSARISNGLKRGILCSRSNRLTFTILYPSSLPKLMSPIRLLPPSSFPL